MKQQQHITAFKAFDNEVGYIKCVISGEDKDSFSSMGFVFSADDVVSESQELDRLLSLQAKAKEYKIKGWGRMSEETLSKKIAEYEA